MRKKKKKNIKLRLFILLVLAITGYGYFEKDNLIVFYEENILNNFQNNQVNENVYLNADTVTIANWNIQIFGTKRASNQTQMEFYAQTVNDYDIIIIQEIRDISNTAFPQLCSMLEGYNCKNSSRAGRSNVKEQYGIIYKDGINIIGFEDFNPDELDRWERAPLKVNFDINNYSIIVYTIHTQPSNVQEELMHLESIVNKNEGKVMIIGDLNADCRYYNTNKNNEFDNWHWIITQEHDTTVANTRCAYDRIILNDAANEDLVDFGIFKEGITKDISDHYLIWAELAIN